MAATLKATRQKRMKPAPAKKKKDEVFISWFMKELHDAVPQMPAEKFAELDGLLEEMGEVMYGLLDDAVPGGGISEEELGWLLIDKFVDCCEDQKQSNAMWKAKEAAKA